MTTSRPDRLNPDQTDSPAFLEALRELQGLLAVPTTYSQIPADESTEPSHSPLLGESES
jgi:hypothetical protein